MKNSILYLECASGISGDMTVAALLDLGADRQVLMDALNSLPLSGYSIEIKDVYKSGIRACDFNVILDANHENHDHDMAYLHGHNHDGIAFPAQSHDEAHHHDHDHGPDDSHHHHDHDFEHDNTHHHEPGEPHHHDQEPGKLHDHEPGEPHHHEPGDPHHHHDHDHTGAHSHESRNLQDIVQIIRAGRLSETAASLAIRIFEILAKAEASVHGKSIEEVHFHEVGAVDSIVDIVAAAVCLDNLHPDEVILSTLIEGHGQIRCQHGLIPIPVPAVSAIAIQEGLVMKLTDIEGELVTPTGAAIAAAIRTGDKLPEAFRIRKVGMGAGKRDYATAGILRAMWIEDARNTAPSPNSANINHAIPMKAAGMTGALNQAPNKITGISGSPNQSACIECEEQTDSAACEDRDSILVLETNIDDCTGEALAFTMQQLLSAGALDVFYIPIYMKKNRPAYLLKTICNKEDRETLEAIIFQNTTTIGIRRQSMERTKLSREIISMQTPWGTADVKRCVFEDSVRYFPENDSVSRLAAENQIGFPEMYRLLQSFSCEHLTS